MLYLIIFLALVALFFFTRSVLILLFSMENYNVHRKRLKQLNFNKKKKEDVDMSELVNTVTKPVIRHVLSRFKPNNLEQLEIRLRMAKWDNTFTPIQYRALSLLLKAVGLVLFLLLSSVSAVFGLIIGGLVAFGIDYLFRNSVKNRRDKLVADFPDFIRITEGYLSASVPFSQAVAESIKYVGDEWKPILQNFVVESDVKSIDEALENLKKEVDLFEVREFVALVRLTMEQGGDAKESFSAQAEKIREMQMNMIAMKIGKRKMMGMVVQAPLLLCNLLVFGLPTFASMGSLTTM